MATFYVLPPRAFLGEWFAGYLRTCFPGVNWSPERWPELADLLHQAVAGQPDVYLIHREDLPADAELSDALIDGCGVEAGDDVVEIHPASVPGKWVTRRWRLAVLPLRNTSAA